MATITSEIVTEYFSEMNLRKAPFILLDETLVGTQMFELSWGDYYKFTMNQLIKKHD